MNQLRFTLLSILLLIIVGCKGTSPQSMEILHPDDSTTLIKLQRHQYYLLAPIEENQREATVVLLGEQNEEVKMDLRLAVDSVDYFVPIPIPRGKDPYTIKVVGLSPKAITWEKLQLADSFDTSHRDYYRPSYHHSPAYGWMNDPNGMIYKDGVYHLYYQYNPYGSRWGNMHWGHSRSRDLIHWEHLPPALARDTMGHIFSGSAILDREGRAGFGKNAILAYYTAHKIREGKQWQAQCLAYSTDDGLSYTKYKGNPILTPSDGISDFRDPKVFWYEPNRRWYMIVSADKEMRFFRSEDLKRWEYVSAFGEGYGARPNQFECPDFFELPLEGSGEKKWAMLVNINPG